MVEDTMRDIASILDLHRLYQAIQEIRAHGYQPKYIEVGDWQWRLMEECMMTADPSSIRIWGLPVKRGPCEQAWMVR